MIPARILALAAGACLAFAQAAPALAQRNDLAQAEQLYRQGEHDRALERVDAYLAGRPGDARGRFLRGVIYTAQKKNADAIRTFTELTYDYPELPEPYNNLGVLHAAQGNYDKARAALEMAIRANPGYAAAHENLGDIYARMAGQSYERAIKLDRAGRTAPAKLKLVSEITTAGTR